MNGESCGMAMKCSGLVSSSPFPLIDLSKAEAQSQLVKACEEVGFFKVINHGVPFQFMADLESQALQFFSLPLSHKLKAGPPNPFGYGNTNIGHNGDVGCLEYFLLTAHPHSNYAPIFGRNFRSAVDDYLSAVKKMACEILEMLAEGLKIHPRNVFSKLLMDEQSDSVFRVNYYPARPERRNLTGFGEHTDPQIISVLRSNDSPGLQISSKDGDWISVPPDQYSFFINVGDSLQVRYTHEPTTFPPSIPSFHVFTFKFSPLFISFASISISTYILHP